MSGENAQQTDPEQEPANENEVTPLQTSFGERVSKVLLPLAGFLVFAAIWWLFKIAFGWPEFILPSPLDVAETLVAQWPLLLENSWVTIYEVALGFALAVVIAVPIAILVAYSSFLDRAMSPLLFAFNAIPKIAIAPILVVWMGFGASPKIVMVILLSFFPIVLSTAAGLRSTPSELRELIHSMSASGWQAFWKVRFPSALPQVFVGLKVAISLAVIGAVIGEFVGATSGLGYVIVVSGGNADTSLAFAAIVLLGVISIVFYYGLTFLERRLVPWAEE